MMFVKSRHSNANGIISALVLACGITLCVLIAVLLKREIEIFNDVLSQIDGTYIEPSFASIPVWLLGFAFIVPGLLGTISAFARFKCLYIVHMVFSILTLLIMGIFLIIGIIAIGALVSTPPPSCVQQGNICTCSNSYSTGSEIKFDCDLMTSVRGLGVGTSVMLVFGWIFTLVSTILSGILACRSENPQGMVMHNMPSKGYIQ
ncbi:uncharacterized protein LOC124258044 [Haliotis rubra]|uniref:uncharacterized protein LOC124258044 n=1 Tax=Haliotis rubra TaxID=36100 RepID=UPI001EE5FAD1|nr:uncharacterized protein LOC124258044 [Haliotis rubra]